MRFDNDTGLAADDAPAEDSVLRRLTREERMRLNMDSWEPSLLRRLLKPKHDQPATPSGRQRPPGTTPGQRSKIG